MAIDSATKRASAFGYCGLPGSPQPAPSTLILAGPRQDLWGLYIGILAGEPPEPPSIALSSGSYITLLTPNGSFVVSSTPVGSRIKLT